MAGRLQSVLKSFCDLARLKMNVQPWRLMGCLPLDSQQMLNATRPEQLRTFGFHCMLYVLKLNLTIVLLDTSIFFLGEQRGDHQRLPR